jgi:thiol-disulfide isomerase/thioredoxin
MNVNTAAESDILVQPRTIGATMNVYEDWEERRDWFQPYTRSQLTNALENDVNVVLYFSADRCPSCQLLTKSLEADQFAFPDDLLVLSIDFDEQKDLVSEYGIVRQHTLIFLDSNGDEDKRAVWTTYTLADVEAEL